MTAFVYVQLYLFQQQISNMREIHEFQVSATLIAQT